MPWPQISQIFADEQPGKLNTKNYIKSEGYTYVHH